MSKNAQSGLRTIKRDFSSSTMSSSSQPIDVDSLDWPLTPPQPKKALSGSEQRLKDIQDALAGNPSDKPFRPIANSSSTINKRPYPSSSSQQEQEPPAKKRQIPNSWQQAPLPTSMPSKQAIANAASSKVKTVVVPAVPVKTSSKPAKVFLSQEQTQILKLVGEGNSLFYTGSAGEFSSDQQDYAHIVALCFYYHYHYHLKSPSCWDSCWLFISPKELESRFSFAKSSKRCARNSSNQVTPSLSQHLQVIHLPA